MNAEQEKMWAAWSVCELVSIALRLAQKSELPEAEKELIIERLHLAYSAAHASYVKCRN